MEERTYSKIILEKFTLDELTYIKNFPDDYLKAITIIGRVYAEEKDKSGFPTVDHFIRVSDLMDDEVGKVIGLLHDLVEDKNALLNDLLLLGFSREIVDALEILTNDKEKYNFSYHDYVTQVINSGNYYAISIKFWDMQDNISPIRMDYLPIEKQLKTIDKYRPELPRIERAFNELNKNKLERKMILND